MMLSKKSALFLILFLCIGLLPAAAHEDMAHVRVGHFVAGAPNVDVYFNGEVVLEDFAPGSLSDYLEVEHGTISVVIAPTGDGVEGAVIGPVDVELEAERNYSLSAIGQVADDSFEPLVIDETTAMQNCDMSRSVFRIIINNVAGLPSISFYENDEWVEKNIEYGSYSAACIPAFFWDTGKAVEGEDLDKIVFEFDSEEDGNGAFWEPYTVYMWGLMGTYPGTPDEDYMFGGGNWHTVAPDLSTFLSAFSGLNLTNDSQLFFQFDTAVQALQATGLDETLAEDGPYTVFIPTDQAFAALADGTLDEWMADPQALKNVLSYHVVKGSYRYDDLIEAGSLATLQGSEITFTPPENVDDFYFYINSDTRVMNYEYPLPDGSIVWFIDNESVLIPPA
jgi:hypothetical protein